MIFHFKFIILAAYLFISLNCQAMEVFKISFEDEFSRSRSLVVKKILEEKYLIPEILIDYEFINNCNESLLKAMVHLCINSKGELIAINVDQEFLLKTMKTFSQGDLR